MRTVKLIIITTCNPLPPPQHPSNPRTHTHTYARQRRAKNTSPSKHITRPRHVLHSSSYCNALVGFFSWLKPKDNSNGEDACDALDFNSLFLWLRFVIFLSYFFVYPKRSNKKYQYNVINWRIEWKWIAVLSHSHPLKMNQIKEQISKWINKRIDIHLGVRGTGVEPKPQGVTLGMQCSLFYFAARRWLC